MYSLTFSVLSLAFATPLMAVVDKSQPIFIYCSCVACSRSYRASAKAVSWGFQTVHYLRGGMAAVWKQAGYPVVVAKKAADSTTTGY